MADVFHVQLAPPYQLRVFQAPPGVLIPNLYTGFGQPLDVACTATGAPTGCGDGVLAVGSLPGGADHVVDIDVRAGQVVGQ
jgi:hypothetical protein